MRRLLMLLFLGLSAIASAEEPARNHPSRGATSGLDSPARELPAVARDMGQDSTLAGESAPSTGGSGTDVPTCTDPAAINYGAPATRCYYPQDPIVSCGAGMPTGYDPATCDCPGGQEAVAGVCVAVCGPTEMRDPVTGNCVCDPLHPSVPSGADPTTCACPPPLVVDVGTNTCVCPPGTIRGRGGACVSCPSDTPTGANAIDHPTRPCACEPPEVDSNGAAAGGTCQMPTCPAGAPSGANAATHPSRPCQCEPPLVDSNGAAFGGNCECPSGTTYNALTNTCDSPMCPSGTPSGANAIDHPTRPCACEPPFEDSNGAAFGGVCECPSGTDYNAATNSCDAICPSGTPSGANPAPDCSCPAPLVDSNGGSWGGICQCPSGTTYSAATNTCEPDTCPAGTPAGANPTPDCTCPAPFVDSNGAAFGGSCECPSGTTFDALTNTCTAVTCPAGTPSGANPPPDCSCPSPFVDSNGAAFGGTCECPAGTSYNPATNTCEAATCPAGTPSGANDVDHPTRPCQCEPPFEDSNGAAVFGGTCECRSGTVYDPVLDRCTTIDVCDDASALNYGEEGACVYRSDFSFVCNSTVPTSCIWSTRTHGLHLTGLWATVTDRPGWSYSWTGCDSSNRGFCAFSIHCAGAAGDRDLSVTVSGPGGVSFTIDKTAECNYINF